jgi:PAS domain S-box-containing protein
MTDGTLTEPLCLPEERFSRFTQREILPGKTIPFMEDGMQVLYVDDEPGLLEIAKIFLEQNGNFRVDTGTSAEVALESSKILSYDAIISDYLMPDMDGIIFLKEIRKRYGDIPFILFTGRGREEIVIEAINNGVDFYLQKGGDPQAQFAELAHKVRQAVLRKEADNSRKKAETALRENEERLQLLIRHAPAALAMFDKEMRYLAASRRWMADYHLGDRDLAGCSHYEIFPEITEELKAVHRRGLSGEVVSADEEKFERQDGSLQWIAWEVRPWYTTGNTVGGIIIFSEDITRRKMVEEALRESEGRLHLAIEASSDGLFDWNLERDTAYFSPRFFTMLGYAPGELPSASSTWISRLHPDDRDRTLSIISEYRAGTRECHAVEFRLRTKDGSWKWILNRAKITGRNAEGKPVRMVGTHSDITDRKLTEESLRQKTEELDQFFTASIDLFCIADTSGYFRRLNTEWERTLGYTLAELEGHRFLDFVHPDDLPSTRAAIADLSDQKQIQNFTNRYRHKDGTYRWIEWRSLPSGERIFAAARDVTGRKLQEQEIQQSRDMFRAFIDHSYDAILISDLSGQVLDVNETMLTMYRVSRDRALTLTIEDISGPASRMDLEGSQKIWNEVLAGKDHIFPWQAMRPSDGSFFDVEVYLTRIEIWDMPVILANIRDVTDRKQAQAALRESEEKYRHIIENMQDAYIRTDENGIITMVNPSAVRMFGYCSEEEMTGVPSASLYLRPEDREELLQKLMDAGGITDFSGDSVRKDGTTFPVSINVQFNRDEQGRIRGTEGIVRDITERKTMERAVREANRKLALLSSITRHDIANQLTILKGFTQFAAAQERDPEIRGYLARIDTGSVTIQRQIEFMKTYQDLGIHTPGWFPLRKTVINAARPEVTFFGTCNDIEVFSDPMLEKVFFNLFENAMQHGNHVSEIRVWCEQVPDTLVISVEDNGIGIPEDEKEKIFKKGFGKHTGLGLFLAREILAITGIMIRECGKPGKGAKFEIVVPKGQFRSAR